MIGYDREEDHVNTTSKPDEISPVKAHSADLIATRDGDYCTVGDW